MFPDGDRWGNKLYTFPVLNPAQRTNERTNDCIGNNEREQSASRVIDPPLRSAPRHLIFGTRLTARSPAKNVSFFPLRAETPARRNSRETATRIARQPARNWFHPEKSHWVASKRAFRAFKTGSNPRPSPFEETDIFAERTNERTIRRDATRRERDARRRWFRAFEPAEVSIERARERALLTYSRYCTITTPVPASILFTTSKRSHDARMPAVVDRLRKKGISR